MRTECKIRVFAFFEKAKRVTNRNILVVFPNTLEMVERSGLAGEDEAGAGVAVGNFLYAAEPYRLEQTGHLGGEGGVALHGYPAARQEPPAGKACQRTVEAQGVVVGHEQSQVGFVVQYVGVQSAALCLQNVGRVTENEGYGGREKGAGHAGEVHFPERGFEAVEAKVIPCQTKGLG